MGIIVLDLWLSRLGQLALPQRHAYSEAFMLKSDMVSE
jgi:hypothetical protein